MNSAISTNHLSRHYGKVEAVRELTFEVQGGKPICAFGPERRRQNNYDPYAHEPPGAFLRAAIRSPFSMMPSSPMLVLR